MKRFTLASLIVTLLPSPVLRAGPPETADLTRKAVAVLEANCQRCHGKDGSNEGGMNYILDLKKLVERKKVVPGNPGKSRLLRRVAEGDMPPEGESPRPSKADIAVLKAWIESANIAAAPAPEPTKESKRPFVSLADNLEAMRQHLRRNDRAARPYQRYFTFTHLHNNPKIGDRDLRLYQAALSKLLNSLSWKRAVVLPQPVDAAQTVFAVDIRKLDWDRRHLWNEVLKNYPYGLRHDRYPDDATARDTAQEVYELAGTELPAVRADWFLAIASRPPLYHTLLQLPANAHELEMVLRVDVCDNFQRGELARAGFSASGVSRQNRMIERHESTYGAYLKSYDFKTNEGRGNLFRFPLGPRFHGNVFDHQAFEHAGGEIIFSLPNGLQGYMLVDNKDRRIDAGPTEIVRDKTETSGSVAIVNGLSCMSCHQHGPIKDFKDTVRDGHALAGEPRDKVRELYPEAGALAKLMEGDEDRFLRALDRATGLYLKVGADQNKEIGDFPEVIGPLARLYLLREVGPEEAAFELGLQDVKMLQTAIRANPRLRALGLLPLVQGNTIKRDVWESLEALVSPFQETARALELGTPVRVR